MRKNNAVNEQLTPVTGKRIGNETEIKKTDFMKNKQV
jgi:hypothetical protein